MLRRGGRTGEVEVAVTGGRDELSRGTRVEVLTGRNQYVLESTKE